MKLCPKCSAEHDKPGTFCSRKCANSRGPRTEEFKRKVSEKLSGRTHTHGNGRGFNIETEFICLNCETEFKAKVNSKTTRKFCSCKCHTEFTRWNHTEKEEYYRKCKFTFNTFDYPDFFNNSLFEQYGTYSASNRGNNPNGISRDHAYSVSEGFKNNIDPKLISHPANCVLMKHDENNKKNNKCSLTLNELTDKICVFDEKYVRVAE